MNRRTLVFVLTVLALLVITDAKFGRKKKADQDGHYRFHGRQARGDKVVDLKYDATLRVNPDDIIDLDDVKPAAVECYPSRVVVLFSEDAIDSSFRDVTETKSPLTWTAGDVIVGGSEYGCILDNKPHDMIRRITRINRMRQNYVLQTVTVDLSEVFDQLNGTIELIKTEQYFVNPAFSSSPQEVFPLSPSESRSKRAIEATYKFLSPAPRNVFLVNDTLTAVLQSDYTSTLYFYLYIDTDGPFNTEVQYKEVNPVNGMFTFTLPITSAFTPSAYYYIDVYTSTSSLATSVAKLQYLSINYNETGYISEPAPNSEYYWGTNLEVTFLLDDTTDVTVQVYRNIDDGFDHELDSREISVQQGVQTSLNFTIGYSWPKSNYYYVYLTWNCYAGYFCSSATSEYFTIRDNKTEPLIGIKSPNSATSLQTGSNLTLEWEARGPVSNMKVLVHIDRMGRDPTIKEIIYGALSAGNFTARLAVIPSDWPSSAKYYIEVRYNCTVDDFCDSVRTNFFSVAFKPQIQYLTPGSGQRFDVGDILSVTWQTALTKSATIALHVEYPIYVPSIFPLYSAEVNLASRQANILITEEFKSIFPVYIEISYDCALFGYFCTVERSQQFFINYVLKNDFNYNELTARAENVYPIFKQNCTTLFDKDAPCVEDTYTTLPCEFCKAGGLLEIRLDCENCWVRTEVSLSVITFSLSNVSINMNAGLWINVDLAFRAEGSYAKDGLITLNQSPIPVLTAGFSLVGIPVDIGLVANFRIKWDVTIEARMLVTAGFDVHVPLDLQIDSSGSNEVAVDLDFNVHYPELTAQGSATLTARLVCELSLTALSLLEFKTQVIPYTIVTGWAQYPAYPAIAPPGHFEESEYYYGDCTVAHFAQYDVQVGSNISFIAAWRKSSRTWEYGLTDPFSLLSGCFLPVYASKIFSVTPAGLQLPSATFASLVKIDLINGLAVPLFFEQLHDYSFDIEGTSTQLCLEYSEQPGFASIAVFESQLTAAVSDLTGVLYDLAQSTITPYLIQPDPPAEPVSTPVATPVAVPVASTPVSVPLASPTGSPVAVPITAPIAVPVATPSAAPTSQPLAAPVSSPLAVPVATPIAVPTSSPVNVPISTPVAVPVNAPTSVPVTVPISTPLAPPTAGPNDSPVSAPTTAPVTEPIASPVTVPVLRTDDQGGRISSASSVCSLFMSSVALLIIL